MSFRRWSVSRRDIFNGPRRHAIPRKLPVLSVPDKTPGACWCLRDAVGSRLEYFSVPKWVLSLYSQGLVLGTLKPLAQIRTYRVVLRTFL